VGNFGTFDADAAASDPDRELLATTDVAIGEFRCAPERPDFSTAGVITRHSFVFPRCGVWIHQEGYRPFVADANRIVLYNPHQPFERGPVDPSGDRSDWINVSERIVREIVSSYDGSAAESSDRTFRLPFVPADSRLYAAHRELHEYVVRAQYPDPLLVEESAVHLLAGTVAALYQSIDRPRRKQRFTAQHRATVERVCEHLNATFRSNHSLAEIAATFNRSVFHLCRIFRRGTGLTIHAYRQQLRLRHALEALEDPQTDILSLAMDLGYSGHSHFTAAFRRVFGEAPSQTRQRLRALSAETPRPLHHLASARAR
jgi:AraC-like DNA-binding protein